MKQTHQNFWNMERDVIAFFDKNESEWSSISVLNANVEKLRSNELQIAAADKTQKEKNQSGYTTQKDLQFEKMTLYGYKLSCKVVSYALEINNRALLNLVNFSSTQLEAGSEKEVATRCQIIADKASENLQALTDYTVTAEEIATYQEVIDNFNKMPAERDLIANERKGAVKTIPELITDARSLFEKIDNNVDGLVNNTAFINEYHQIRNINSRRGGRNSVKTEPVTTDK